MESKQKVNWRLLLLLCCGLGFNILGKHIALRLSLPLWMDTVGTVWAGMVCGPYAGMLVGFLTNVVLSGVDSVTVFYMMINVVVGLLSGVLYYRKEYRFGQLILGGLLICGVGMLLCAPMNLLFYDGYTGNVMGDLLYQLLADAGAPIPICAIVSEALIELLDKLASVIIAQSLYALIRSRIKENDSAPPRKKNIFAVYKAYNTLVIGAVIVVAILVLMIILAYIWDVHQSKAVSLTVVFLYLCFAAGIIILTIFLLTRKIDEKEAQYQEMRLLYARLEENQKQLENARKTAEEANQAKTRFLFSMSHDMRTPMNAVIGFTGLMQRELDQPEKLREHLKKLESSGNYLMALVSNVLEMARIESNELKLEESVCDVRELCDSLVNVFAGQMWEKELAFTHSCSLRHGLVTCDVLKLQEVFTNILSNAMKYTLPGGLVSLSITEPESESDDPERTLLQTVISDTGAGMSPDYLPHIFELFSREKTSTESQVFGSGLGMPIVKRLVDAMHGTIDVESSLGKGTTVTVRIPCRIAESEESGGASPEESSPASVLKGRHVLLVEDNMLNAEIATDILEEFGVAVDHAENGQVCLDMLKQAELPPDPGSETPHLSYDFILMDIQMPVMNGYEASAAIRALYPEDPIPIIAVSANAFEEDRRASLAAGMDAHVAKPINVRELTGVMIGLLKKR